MITKAIRYWYYDISYIILYMVCFISLICYTLIGMVSLYIYSPEFIAKKWWWWAFTMAILVYSWIKVIVVYYISHLSRSPYVYIYIYIYTYLYIISTINKSVSSLNRNAIEELFCWNMKTRIPHYVKLITLCSFWRLICYFRCSFTITSVQTVC